MNNEHDKCIYRIEDLQIDLFITDGDEFVSKVDADRGDESATEKNAIVKANQQTRLP